MVKKPAYKNNLKHESSENDQIGCISFTVRQIVEINTNGPPRPYDVHSLKQPEEISFVPVYSEDKKNLLPWIQTLISVFEDPKPAEDPQIKVTNLMLKKANAQKFDRRNLESMNEKPLFHEEIFVQRVLPMITIYGGRFTVCNVNYLSITWNNSNKTFL